MCERAMERTIAPDTKLADKDIVRMWIAECAAEIRSARLLTLNTAWKIERYGWREARQEISMIKFLVAKAMLNVLDRAIQVHGGLGVTDDTVLAWFWRHERAARIYDGADEVHKISLARRILRDVAENGSWQV
jgi:alkylation response protein AidB-like acyl-CoA dehydrogenase